MILDGVLAELPQSRAAHWERACRTLRKDCKGVFDGRLPAGDWLQQRPREYARWLTLLEIGQPDAYLEIGCAGGATLALAHKALPAAATLFAIDNGKHKQSRFFTTWLKKSKARAEVLLGNSHSAETGAWLLNRMRSFQFVFVDGDHSTAGLLLDLALIRPFLSDNGLVGCHDFAMESVRRGLDSAVAGGEWAKAGMAYDDASLTRRMGIVVLRRAP